MKELTGTASAATAASPEAAMALLEAIERYPEWHADVVKQAEVLERDAAGHPTRARTRLHVERGPLTRDFDLVMSVTVDPAGTIKLSRIPEEPGDKERFDVTWRVDGGAAHPHPARPGREPRRPAAGAAGRRGRLDGRGAGQRGDARAGSLVRLVASARGSSPNASAISS